MKCVAVLILALTMLGAPAVRAAEPLEINVILSLTGGGAFLGKQEAQALAAFEALANKSGGIGGRALHFAVQDDGSSPQVAVQLASGLIQKHVALILGPTLVGPCRAVGALVERDGPVNYCLSSGIYPKRGSYVFAANYATTDTMAAIVHFFRDRGCTRLAYIVSTDATGQDAEESMNAVFALPENKNLRIVDREHFNTTDVTVAAQMSRVKAANPQALLVWSTGAPAGTVFRGLREAGMELPVGTTGGNLTYAQMQQYAAFLPKELYFGGSPALAPERAPDRATRAAVERLRSAVGKVEQGQLLAWDVVLVVTAALGRVGPDATAAQLHDELEGMRVTGAAGNYDFATYPQRGLGPASIVVIRWEPAADRWIGVSGAGGRTR